MKTFIAISRNLRHLLENRLLLVTKKEKRRYIVDELEEYLYEK